MADLKNKLPQEGTRKGESLDGTVTLRSSSPAYSGGGKNLLVETTQRQLQELRITDESESKRIPKKGRRHFSGVSTRRKAPTLSLASNTDLTSNLSSNDSGNRIRSTPPIPTVESADSEDSSPRSSGGNLDVAQSEAWQARDTRAYTLEPVGINDLKEKSAAALCAEIIHIIEVLEGAILKVDELTGADSGDILDSSSNIKKTLEIASTFEEIETGRADILRWKEGYIELNKMMHDKLRVLSAEPPRKELAPSGSSRELLPAVQTTATPQGQLLPKPKRQRQPRRPSEPRQPRHLRAESDELTALRAAALAARRKYQRYRRKKDGDPDEMARLRVIYGTACRAVCVEYNRSKEVVRDEAQKSVGAPASVQVDKDEAAFSIWRDE